MSKLMINAALLPLKTAVNAYTVSTLPFYYLYQRPWQRLQMSKLKRMTQTVDRHGRIIYSRPAAANLSHPFYQYKTVSEVFDSLDRSKISVGHRQTISEKVELDQNGNPIQIDGRELKKVELSKDFIWQSVGEVLDHVDAMARGFREMGIKKGDKVMIYAENSIDWFYTSLAMIRLNAVVVTLFSTLGDSGVVYGINQSEVRYIVTSQDLLPRLNRISDKLGMLESIVYITDKTKQSDEQVANLKKNLDKLEQKYGKVRSLDETVKIGSQIAPCKFEPASEDDIAVIMYTSGTTGNPKGVILNHKQIQSSLLNMLKMDEEFDLRVFNSTFATYLPMAHLFGYLINIGVFLTTNKMAFCSPFTLLDSSPSHVEGQVGDLRLFKPKVIFSVPLVLERIVKEIYRKLESRSPIAAPLFTYLMDYKIRWTERGFDTPIINRLVCKKINDQFGGNLELIGVSSAPLHVRTQSLSKAALNITLIQAYGATEACGGTHGMNIHDMSLGRCGAPYSGVQTYLENWEEGGYFTTDKPNPRGEIVVGGESVALGYFKNEEETKQAFHVDEDGVRWFKTGDIGEIFPDGSLKIIDRKKDLTKLANGEFVSLGKIESGLRATKYVENICICTDPYHNQITALISPNKRAILELAEKISKSNQTVEQLCDDPDIIRHVMDSLKQACHKLDFKGKEVPAQITLVKEEWTPENNLLTAALKLKRRMVADFYKTQIQEMFAKTKND